MLVIVFRLVMCWYVGIRRREGKGFLILFLWIVFFIVVFGLGKNLEFGFSLLIKSIY